MRVYKIGENLSKDDVRTLTSGKNQPGWYDTSDGQRVYICDGCHRDGYYGFRVLDLGGLK